MFISFNGSGGCCGEVAGDGEATLADGLSVGPDAEPTGVTEGEGIPPPAAPTEPTGPTLMITSERN